MARRRRRRTLLKPRAPARVRKTKRAKKARGHQHPELIGLGLAALGIFLASVMWAGWSGGYIGLWIADGLHALIGSAAWGLPVVLIVVGSLMVGRSDLVDVRPFRTGLVVLAVGLMLILGKDQGGYAGAVLGGALALAIGGTGVAIVGTLAVLAGCLLVTGASAGALVRRSGTAVRRTATAARRSLDRALPEAADEPPELISTANAQLLVDRASQFPAVVGTAEPAPVIPFPELDTQESAHQPSLFDSKPLEKDYELPDRAVLRRSGTNG